MERGDALPEHAHDAANEHNVIVLNGSVQLSINTDSGGRAHIELNQGHVRDFDGSRSHTIRCLSERATILNMWLHGIPHGYADLPESEHQGTL